MATDNQPVAQQIMQPADPAVPVQAASLETAPPEPASVDTRKPATALKLPRPEFWTMVKIAAFVVIAVWTLVNIGLFWLNGVTPRGLIWALWWPAFFMAQFIVFTTPWRAVTAKQMVQMFLIGMGIVFFAIYFGEIIVSGVISAFPGINPINWFLSQKFVLGGYDPMSDVASPLVEEIFDVLPVVIFLLIAGRGYWKRVLGPLDIALLCGSVGAGFQFMENIARVTGSNMSTLGWDRSVRPASFGIDPFYLFPDMYHGSVSVWPGHAETAMFIGLCLGFGLLVRKKIPYAWAALPVLGTLWMIWLHFLINYMGRTNQQFWAQIMQFFNLNGGLFQYVLILGLLLAIAVSMITKYVYLQKDKDATLSSVGKATLEYVKANQKEPLLIAAKLWSLRHFWSFRHAVAYGVIYAKQQKPEERDKWLPWLQGLRQIALGKPPEAV